MARSLFKTPTYSEEQLIKGFNNRSEKSLAIIFKDLYPALCFYASRFVDDQGAAEDIAEESFIKIWERRETFVHYKVLRSFLYSTVRNACLNLLKQKERHSLHEKEIFINAELSESSVLENIIRTEVFRDVYLTLETLPPKCRTIISMIFFQGKSVREVAEKLNLSIGTVKTQKARGLKLLKERLPMILYILIVLKMIK